MANGKKRWLRTALIALGALALAAFIILGIRAFVILRARQVPSYDAGTWLEITPSGVVSANGEPVKTRMRIGSENNVIVFFYGGGISVNEDMAARPFTGAADLSGENGFYTDSIDGMIPDYCELGLGSSGRSNPFRDWTIIIIPYTTADFHIGTGEYSYTDLSGREQTLYHHGYTNYRAVMDIAAQYAGMPDELLIAGYSAGGFGAVMLADDLIRNYFPEAGHVTVCVDSSYLLWNGWEEAVRDIWNAPEEIAEKFVSDNPIVDFMTALYETYGEEMTYLFIGSTRDGELSRYQNYFDTGVFRTNNALGSQYTDSLRQMLGQLKRNVPTLCVYLFDQLPFSMRPDQFTLTQHTILVTNTATWPLTDRLSALVWLHGAVYGNLTDHGLDKLRYEPNTPAETGGSFRR